MAFIGLVTSDHVKTIPFFHKPNSSHHDCAPVCLKMALAYFGIEKELSEISSAARALGLTHYALPWGMCLAAAKWGLYATFISKHPDALINEDVAATATGMTADQVRHERVVRKSARERVADPRASGCFQAVKKYPHEMGSKKGQREDPAKDLSAVTMKRLARRTGRFPQLVNPRGSVMACY